MIDRIFQTVKAFLNVDQVGNFKPSIFEVILHNKVLEILDEALFDLNRLLNRENRGLINGGLENLPDKVRERIQHYIDPAKVLAYSDGIFTLPTDLRYFDTVLFKGETVEMCKSNREFIAVSTTSPEEDFPIGLKQGSIIKILPTSIQADVTVSYIRNPTQAKWTYDIVDGVELFNPSKEGFIDVDIHTGSEVDLIIRILQSFGLNLKEKDILEFTQIEKNQNFNQENAN